MVLGLRRSAFECRPYTPHRTYLALHRGNQRLPPERFACGGPAAYDLPRSANIMSPRMLARLIGVA
jgi:hypothetical protein